ncbi:MAG: GNAT family N-acetyltransferase [Caldilineaceae bacterium]
MSIQIRVATPDDAAAIWHLNDLYDDVRATVEQIRTKIVECAGIETTLLATVEEGRVEEERVKNQVVGFLCLRLVPQTCDPTAYAEVSELFVEEAYRRQGVAHALMTRAKELAREAGATQIVLLTGFKNARAQRFYHSEGFENYCVAMCARL